MASNREERLMMRQRGAGTRQVKDFGFDLILPDQSTSPLKPRKSGRAQKTLQPELAPQKSSRKTPKSAETCALAKPEIKWEVLPTTNEEDKGEQDILCSGVPEKHDELTTTRKRKLDKDGGLDGPATKKTRKPTRKSHEMSRATTLKGRPPGAIFSRKVWEDGGNDPVENGAVDDESGAATFQTESVKVMGQSSRVRTQTVERVTTAERRPEVGGEVVKPNTRTTKKPVQRKRQTRLEDTEDVVQHGPHDRQDLETEKVAPTVTPPKKRKKRRSIGQQSMKRVKRPTDEAKQPVLGSKSNHEISDLVNELLDSTIDIAPEKPGKDPLPSQKSAETLNPQPKAIAQEVPAPNTNGTQESRERTAPAANAIALEMAEAHEQPSKSKPRKKRRPIAQVKRPKKRAAVKVDVRERSPLPKTEDDVEPTPVAIPPSVITKVPKPRSEGRPSKPLSDITNSTPKIILQRTEPKPAQDPSQHPAPVKRRGRPRKNAAIESRGVSDLRTAAVKPAGKPTTASATKCNTTSGEPGEAPARTKKASKDSAPTLVHAIPDDIDLDSDDPLSGDITIRPRKVVKPVEILAQVSSKNLGKRDGKPLKKKANALRAEDQDHTPRMKSVDLEKQKELEQREIEELLGSIRKAVRKGRGLAGEA